MSEPAVLLVVLAHPDDESFGMGGTLAHYARRGAQVHLVCATRGEVGMMDEAHMKGFTSIADRRESELRCAAGILGLSGVHFLNYRDSGMSGSPDNFHPHALAAAPLDEVAAAVTGYIRKLRPQVVLTFDPIGGYRHPDHIAIHQATVRAFFAAPDPTAFPGDLPPHSPDRLYFHTIPNTFLRLAVRLMPLFGRDPRRFGQNQDIDLVSIAQVQFPTHAVIGYREVAEQRAQAAACHESQGGKQMSSGLLPRLQRWFQAKETFMQAYPEPAADARQTDLFADLPVIFSNPA